MRTQYNKGGRGKSPKKAGPASRTNNKFGKGRSSSSENRPNATGEEGGYKKRFADPPKDFKGASSYKKNIRTGSFPKKNRLVGDEDEKNFRYQKKTKTKRPENIDFDKGIRLNKYIANAGVCSRREADTYISAGLVIINDKVVTELGVRVMPDDVVKFGNERISPEKKIYIILNKPKGYVTTVDDPEERKTVMDLIRNACKERVVPVGRLDRNTTGLLLFTNDGDLTKKLTHPSYDKKKIYHVVVDNPITRDQLSQIANGIELEDGWISADAVSYVGDLKTEIGIELHSGKNRIVRRIVEHFGLNVLKLDRVYFAGLTKLNLPRGKWRFLTDREVANLKTGMYE